MFGYTEEQIASFGLTFGVGAFYALHTVHHRPAGLGVKGGQVRYVCDVFWAWPLAWWALWSST